MIKRTANSRRGAVANAVATAVSLVIVTAAAALAAVLLARELGRDAETDGFLAAYGIYLLLVLAAQAIRPVLVPDLTRAAVSGRLRQETYAYGFALVLFSLVLTGLAFALRDPIGELVTGALPAEAAAVAARALVWLVPAALAQLLAALLASALAARDSYRLPAFAYALGAVTGLVVFAVFVDEHGVIALAWGLALNGAVTVAVPLAALLVPAMRGGALVADAPFRRLARLARGAAVPLSLQALYLISLRLAADLGVGKVTTLSYAYLIGSVLVATTASSLGLISSAPLTRRGLDAEAAAAHVVHSAWLCVVVIVAAAGVFALAGSRIVGTLLGSAFAGAAGDELGRLLVYLAPWMVASVALSVTFPLLFVVGRSRVLLPLALALPFVQLGLAVGLREVLGLRGVALSLALSTLVALVALLLALSPRALAASALGLGRLTVLQAGVAAVSFGALSLVLGGVPAALAGLVVYAVVLAALRPRGLRKAWAYVRALQ